MRRHPHCYVQIGQTAFCGVVPPRSASTDTSDLSRTSPNRQRRPLIGCRPGSTYVLTTSRKTKPSPRLHPFPLCPRNTVHTPDLDAVNCRLRDVRIRRSHPRHRLTRRGCRTTTNARTRPEVQNARMQKSAPTKCAISLLDKGFPETLGVREFSTHRSKKLTRFAQRDRRASACVVRDAGA